MVYCFIVYLFCHLITEAISWLESKSLKAALRAAVIEATLLAVATESIWAYLSTRIRVFGSLALDF